MSHSGLLDQVVELANAYYEHRDSAKVFPEITPEQLRQAFGCGTPMPQHGEEAERIIAGLADSAGLGLVANTGPRYFGFVIGGSLPVATAADWLT